MHTFFSKIGSDYQNNLNNLVRIKKPTFNVFSIAKFWGVLKSGSDHESSRYRSSI